MIKDDYETEFYWILFLAVCARAALSDIECVRMIYFLSGRKEGPVPETVFSPQSPLPPSPPSPHLHHSVLPLPRYQSDTSLFTLVHHPVRSLSSTFPLVHQSHSSILCLSFTLSPNPSSILCLSFTLSPNPSSIRSLLFTLSLPTFYSIAPYFLLYRSLLFLYFSFVTYIVHYSVLPPAFYFPFVHYPVLRSPYILLISFIPSLCPSFIFPSFFLNSISLSFLYRSLSFIPSLCPSCILSVFFIPSLQYKYIQYVLPIAFIFPLFHHSSIYTFPKP